MTDVNKQDSIKFLESDVEAVRKLPDVYIGALGNAGFLNMIREIIQNSLDEIIKGNTLDLNIYFSFDERTKMVINEDKGQGIELDKLAKVFSVLHSSSNYDKVEGSGKYSSGKNGMGGTITNYLSKSFIAESYRADGSALRCEWVEGKLKSSKSIKNGSKNHGLKIIFVPSDMMGNLIVTVGMVRELIWKLCNLSKPGTTITYTYIDSFGREGKEVIKNTRGISEFIDSITEKSLITPISFMEDTGTMRVECMVSYDLKNMDDPYIMSFGNGCPTSGGTHVDGFMDGFVKYFREYMNKIYLANNKKLSVNIQDIRTGLRAVVSCHHLFPLFQGQSKDVFSKEDMQPYARDVTYKQLSQWAANNPADLQKVAKYLKEVCEIRTKTDGEKVKMNDKYTTSVVSGMPAKYKKPNGKGPFELLITEGDSAANENARDKNTQGIYPIRGKIPNPMVKSPAEFFANEEIAGLFKICGYNGYSRKFDPEKFKPEKIIFVLDADADGDHIFSLLSTLFLRYLPFVITEGKLYRANPPLYGLSTSSGQMKYFTDNIEYVKYIQDLFTKNNDIRDSRNKPMSKKDITRVLYNNIDYVKFLERVCNTYSINPHLLEFILYNEKLFSNFGKLKKAIETQYKFVSVNNKNGVILIEGLVEQKYQTIILNDMLIADCIEIRKLINKDDPNYIINGKKSTIYDLMKIFQSFEPKNLTRYKGLGEMKPAQLGLSTIIPGYGRTLKQYTIDDVKKQLNYVRDIQSSKSAFLKGIDNIRKEDII